MATFDDLKKLLGNYINNPKWGGFYLYNEVDTTNIKNGKVYIINYITTFETNVMGHYAVIDLRDNEPFYFDGYGLRPDIPRYLMKLPYSNIITNLLIYYGNGKYNYNKHDYQYKGDFYNGVYDETCGLYCVEYVLNNNFNSQFWELARKSKRTTFDKLLSIIGNKELKKNIFPI